MRFRRIPSGKQEADDAISVAISPTPTENGIKPHTVTCFSYDRPFASPSGKASFVRGHPPPVRKRGERIRLSAALRLDRRADEIPSVEVLFSVPKKFQKRANKRNLQRRRMKEAYRLNKEIFDREGNPVALDLALIYSSKELTPYRVIEHAVQKIMEQIMARL